MLLEEWEHETDEKEKSTASVGMYQSVVRLLLRGQPASTALSSTEEKLPRVKFVAPFRVSDMLVTVIPREQ